MTYPKSYIICATPRSGTTLLCDLLAESGVAGQPDSFFQLQSRNWWAQHLDVPAADSSDEYTFEKSYLSAVIQKGTAETQIFGMRLMWCDRESLCNRLSLLYPDLSSESALFKAAFGSTSFIYLCREDKVAQAISRIKAEQSGLWHVDADGNERERLKLGQSPVYNAQIILEQVTEYERHEVEWLNWFDQQKIKPLRITYESLSDKPQNTLAMLLSALGQDTKIAATIKPKTTKLADNESHKWANRFRAEKLSH